MSYTRYPVLVLMVFGFFTSIYLQPCQAKTKEEWQREMNSTFDECKKPLKYSDVEIVKILDSAPRFEPDIQSFVRCLDLKLYNVTAYNAETLKKFESFVEEYYKDHPKKNDILKIVADCMLDGKDLNETAELSYICYRDGMKKLGIHEALL